MVNQEDILRVLLGLPNRTYEVRFLKEQLSDDFNFYSKLRQLEKFDYIEYSHGVGKRGGDIHLKRRALALKHIR